MTVKRGDIFYADLSPVVGSEQGGVRPVLIVQNDMGNRYSPTVIAAAITSRKDKTQLPTHISVSADGCGLVKDSIVLAYQIKTGLDKKTLAKLMTEETWMSAAKAIELGFADGLLERETQDTVQAVLFSRKAVDTVFVNKLTERPVQTLYDRLEKLKNDAQAQKERNE